MRPRFAWIAALVVFSIATVWVAVTLADSPKQLGQFDSPMVDAARPERGKP